ncbi:MAG: BTAD domain-containing putative transcriptional regulator [Alphaproteobacteria bacterium]|jgi:DNA-binding SARP family transcriptional activator/Tfp pilus assembly protein PilF|nr:BTAD domain-containing putative transcriptional regulator [Alphaproteobacteria bacterium]
METTTIMLRAEFLSGFRLRDANGTAVDISPLKARALFAYLVIESESRHTREKLACLLWDAAGDRLARQSLRKCLSTLRAAIGPKWARVLVLSNDGVGLAPESVASDVVSLRRLLERGETEAAVDLVGDGSLLDGIEVDSEPFQEWLLAERSHYRELAVSTLYDAAIRQARRGAADAAIKAARRAVSFDPLCEEAHQLLIELYHSIGRPSAAWQQYARCARSLQDELGIAPSLATRTAAFQTRIHNNSSHRAPGTRVVVQDVTCLGTSAADERFSAGLSDDLATELAKHREISVVSEPTDACYVIAATAQIFGTTYRFAIRLLSGADGATLWSDSWEKAAASPLDAQCELVRPAAARLVTMIEQLERRRRIKLAEPVSAADYWHRGNHYYLHYTKEGTAAAKRLYRQAIVIDPDFARAYASLAFAEQFDAFFKYSDNPQASLASGLKLARTAIEIDQSDAHAHLALGNVLCRMLDFDGATVSLETALSLCPSSERAEFALGLTQYYQGRQSRALDHFDRAMRLSPQSPSGWTAPHMMARCHYDLGRSDDALDCANRAVNMPHAKSIAFALKAVAADSMGYGELAQRTLRDVVQRDPTMTTEYVVNTFGNAFLTDAIESMAERLHRIGLPD